MIDQERFQQIKLQILKQERHEPTAERKNNRKGHTPGSFQNRHSIGTLSEKTVHAVLKEYYSEEMYDQEVSLEGCVADIFTGQEIMEIQTRNFSKLKPKLDKFLPLFPVTVIYPICREKWMIWVDTETGELSVPRKSSHKGKVLDIFSELRWIIPYLGRDNLRFRIVMMDMEEYRLLDGYGKDHKKRATKYDRIPLRICDEIDFSGTELQTLLPADLPEPFTSTDLAKAAKITGPMATRVLGICFKNKNVVRVGKKGNSYLYERAKQDKEHDKEIV